MPTTLFGDYFAYWETQGILMSHGLAARHLVTKSNVKGRLLERSSSLTRDATNSKDGSKKDATGTKQGGPRQRNRVATSKSMKGGDDFNDGPVVNKRKLRKQLDEELQTLGTLAEDSAQTRLGARISNAWWSAEGSSNGSAGFVPPHVKARELQQALALYVGFCGATLDQVGG